MSKIPKFGQKQKPLTTVPSRPTVPPITTVPSRPTFVENVPAKPTLSKKIPHEFHSVLNRPAVNLNPSLRRRSKSVTDLRSNQVISIKSKMPIAARENIKTKVQTKTALKRQGASKSQDAPQSKKARVPLWDYKTRFENLQEEFKNLKSIHDDITGKILNFDAMQGELDLLRRTLPEVESARDALTKDKSELENELKFRNEQFKELESSYESLKTDHDHQIAQTEIHQKDNLRLKSEFSRLDSDLTVLRQRCADLEKLARSQEEEIAHQHQLRKRLHNAVQDLKGNIRVFCRVRPPVTMDEKKRVQCPMNFPSEGVIEIRKPRESVITAGKNGELKVDFAFDKVFAQQSSQLDVFEDVSQLVQSALDGYNVCVFAYGQTGSGKTHTMMGPYSDHGVIPRTVTLVFELIEKLKLAKWVYRVEASFMEIYNEVVRDLLNKNAANNCDIKYNEGKGVFVSNLTKKPIESAEELLHWISVANENRAVAATDFNEHSSRSHAITKIYLHGVNEVNDVSHSGSLNLVDLAGSECAKTSGPSRLVETKNINKSLSALADVMLAIYNNDSHIPYRNSKLTFLLQSCLGGNSKTLMLVNLAPFEDCFSETVSSLRFATKVKEVRLNAKRNTERNNI